jgi:WD40 repeat protein
MEITNYYQVGGILNSENKTYVTRTADRQMLELLEKGTYCFVLNAKQMGKSSLIVRTICELKFKGVSCAAIDLTSIDNSINKELWYKIFAKNISINLNLENKFDFDNWWESQSVNNPIEKINYLFTEIILNFSKNSIVIFIDKIEELIDRAYREEFLGWIRSCYERRKTDFEYNRLTFCLLGVARTGDLSQDREKSPFNISKAISLTGFSFTDAREALLPGLSKINNSEEILKQVINWTGGQPFLTQKLCSLIVNYNREQEVDVDKIVLENIINDWQYKDNPVHFSGIANHLLTDKNKAIRILNIYQNILNSPTGITPDGSYEQSELRLSGLVKYENNFLYVYNHIYRIIFNREWIQKKLDELRPYSVELNNWLQDKDNSIWLLQGNNLEQIIEWSQSKSLSREDYEFVRASQAFKKSIIQGEKTINKKKKISLKTKIILTIGAISFLFGGIISYLYLLENSSNSEETAELTKLSENALNKFKSQQIEALTLAMEAGEKLKNNNPISSKLLSQYQTITPITALLNILIKIEEKNYWHTQQSKIEDLIIAPDNKTVVSNGKDGTVKVWNFNGTLKSQISQARKIVAINFDRQGKNIYTINNHQELESRDLDGQIRERVAIGKFKLAKISDDGDTIATLTLDGNIQLWRKNGTPMRTLSLKPIRIVSIAFSQDGQTIAAGTEAGTIQLWKLDGTPINNLIGNEGWVTTVSFSPDDQTIASLNDSGRVKIWKLNGEPINSLPNSQSQFSSLSFNSQGQIALGSLDGKIEIWKVGGKLEKILSHNQGITSVKFTADGKKLVASTDRASIHIWEFNNTPPVPEHILQVKNPQNKINSLNFSRDGKIILVGQEEGEIYLWSRDGSWNNHFRGSKGKSKRAILSPDGETIAVATEKGQVNLWKRDGTFIATLSDSSQIGAITSLTFSPDSKRIALGTERKKIEIWQTKGNLIETWGNSLGGISSAIFTPDEKNLAIGDNKGNISFWQLNGIPSQFWQAHQGSVKSLAMDPQGTKIVSAGSDRIARLWTREGILISALIGHVRGVNSVDFSPDGESIVSGGEDGTIKFWKRDGIPISTIAPYGKQTISSDKDKPIAITHVAFAPDGKAIASAGEDNRVIVWSLDLDRLLNKGCEWLEDYWRANAEGRDRLKSCDLNNREQRGDR